MERLLPTIGNKVIIDENGTNVLPLLNLDGIRELDN